MHADSRSASMQVVAFSGRENGRPRPEQDNKGRFLPGNSGNGGRRLGSRSKMGEEFLADLYDDFVEHGRSVIERVRSEDPVAYLRVIASLVPKQLTVDRNTPADLSDAELGEILLALRCTDT